MDASVQGDLQSLSSRSETAWEAFVSTHPLATPFHTLAWKRSVCEAFDYRPAYRTLCDDGDIVAAVPGFECPELMGATVVNPFCEYGFPLVDGTARAATTEAVLESLRESASGRRPVLLKDADWTGVVGYASAGFGAVETGVTRRLALDGDFEELAEHVFDRTLRRNVERARQEGVRVEETTDVDAFYERYLDAMRRHGSPQFPKAFFEALVAAFDERCSILLARYDGRPIAGLLSLDHGDGRYLLANGSDSDYWHLRPNDVLYWEAVERACARGYEVVDFGRTEPGSGIDRFKERFGGTVEPLTTMVSPPDKAGRASVSGYRRLAALTRRLSPVVTHSKIGPRLKEWIHE